MTKEALDPPKPEEAKNEILKRLFSRKDLEKPCPDRIKNQAIKIMMRINNDKIRKKDLQKLTFNGIHDEFKGLRPIVWRILLNYLPEQVDQW